MRMATSSTGYRSGLLASAAMRLRTSAMHLLSIVVMISTGLIAPAAAAPGDIPEWVIACPVSHRASDDPIVFPGDPGAAHRHDFFGNETTDAFSTLRSLKKGPTTCGFRPDRAAYWFPTLSSNGRVTIARSREGVLHEPSRTPSRRSGRTPMVSRSWPGTRIPQGPNHWASCIGIVAKEVRRGTEIIRSTAGPARCRPASSFPTAGTGSDATRPITSDTWHTRSTLTMTVATRARIRTRFPCPASRSPSNGRCTMAPRCTCRVGSRAPCTAISSTLGGGGLSNDLIQRCLVEEVVCGKISS